MEMRKHGKWMLVIVSVLCMVLLAGSMSVFADEADAAADAEAAIEAVAEDAEAAVEAVAADADAAIEAAAGADADVAIGEALASALEAAPEDSDLKAIVDKGTLVVGITDFAPMDFKGESGEWIGFDADLAKMFAETIGIDVEFQEIDWDNKILELNAGTVDCIWNGMTLTDEVSEAMECTMTYALNAQVVVMKADALANYPDAESMADLSFAVEAGSAGEAVATEAGLTVNAVQNQASALMEVAAGTSDACVIDKTMADAMTGEGTSYADLGYEISLSSEEYVVGFRKGSEAAELLNVLFMGWMVDGTMAELSEKYDNAVSVAELNLEELFAGSGEGESPEGESPEGESPEGESPESEAAEGTADAAAPADADAAAEAAPAE